MKLVCRQINSNIYHH